MNEYDENGVWMGPRCKRCFTPLVRVAQEDHLRKGCVNRKDEDSQ